MSRRIRPGGWLLLGVAAALLLAAVFAAMLTQTARGRERVLDFTLRRLGGTLSGTLTVGRLEGNLFTGARLYRVSLVGRDGEPLLRADSAYIDYQIPTFLGGDIVIGRLIVYDAQLDVTRFPGDSLWNYQEILTNPAAKLDTARVPRATVVERITLVNSHARVVFPWVPDSTTSAAEQREEVRLALSDSSRLVVRRVRGGYVQTMRFDVERAALSEVVIAPDERGGTYLEVDSGRAEAWVYRDPPMHIRGVRGQLSLREGLVRFRVPEAHLPDSRLGLQGTVDLRGGQMRYDFTVEGPEVAFVDLHWLYPRFPREGGGSGRILVETHPEGLFVQASELRLTAPGTRVTGSFGVLLGDTLRFKDVALRASPLNVATVEGMLPTELPVRGLRIGSVEVRGPVGAASDSATRRTAAARS